MPSRLALLAALVLVLVLLAAGYVAIGTPAQPVPAHPFWSGPSPRVIAHRGGRGLWPENTLHAFQSALALGVDVLDMDLRRTADGEIVVLHDDTVDRTTDGRGAVLALSFADLQRLDAGYRWTADGGGTFPYRGRGIGVPSLREVFAALPAARMNLELKERGDGLAAAACALIRSHGMTTRVAVVAFHQEAIDAFRSACPEVATGAARDEVVHFALLSASLLGARFAPRAQVLQVPQRYGAIPVLTERFVHDSRRLNLKLEVWTVNDPEDMKQLLALRVDGIMTDFPDRLLTMRRDPR